MTAEILPNNLSPAASSTGLALLLVLFLGPCCYCLLHRLFSCMQHKQRRRRSGRTVSSSCAVDTVLSSNRARTAAPASTSASASSRRRCRTPRSDAADATADDDDDSAAATVAAVGHRRHRRSGRGHRQRRTLLSTPGDAEAEADSDTERGVELSHFAARASADAVTDDVPLWVREAGATRDDDDDGAPSARDSEARRGSRKHAGEEVQPAKNGQRKSRRAKPRANWLENVQLD